MDRQTLDQHLWALLGSWEKVQAWWNGPNKHWQGRTPESVYETDPDSVTQYVITHCYGSGGS
jgi:hypothetical protein